MCLFWLLYIDQLTLFPIGKSKFFIILYPKMHNFLWIILGYICLLLLPSCIELIKSIGHKVNFFAIFNSTPLASYKSHKSLPEYLIGRSCVAIHSSRWYAAIGCSDVAIKYFSSIDLSSAFSLPFPITYAGNKNLIPNMLISKI